MNYLLVVQVFVRTPSRGLVGHFCVEINTVGFKPRYVRLQSSSGVCIEWYAGMAENSAFKAAADGARTLSASAGVKTDPRGFRVSQNATLAAVVASQTLYYVAQV
jgi:hypothetical protein